jgi:hypothetical protein
MKVPFPLEELDALMSACLVYASEKNDDAKFYAGNVAGRKDVSAEVAPVMRMLAWISATDRELLESLGFGSDNLTYYRIGHDAEEMMRLGGFKRYFRKRRMAERTERTRLWAPIAISFAAATVSLFAWQAPKSAKKIDDLAVQQQELRLAQKKLEGSLAELRDTVTRLPPRGGPSTDSQSEGAPSMPGASKAPHDRPTRQPRLPGEVAPMVPTTEGGR